MAKKPKILVILGPTATGKSALAIEIARKYNGEIISADSRQVYIGLDIGTGKVTKKEMRGVPHHMLDIVSPKKVFSVAEWKKQAEEKIVDILKRGKLPIICGGTGFYIQSVVDNIMLPEVPPNKALRKKLEGKSAHELLKILEKLDWRRAKEIEQKNPIRLIRAIEIAKTLGKVPNMQKNKSPYQFIQIGLTTNKEVLKKKINARLVARIKQGMIVEAKKLHTNRLSYKRMRSLGLEYKYLANFLEKKISKQELVEKLDKEIYDYAKRQITWFKRDKKIKWFDISEKNLENKVLNFLK